MTTIYPQAKAALHEAAGVEEWAVASTLSQDSFLDNENWPISKDLIKDTAFLLSLAFPISRQASVMEMSEEGQSTEAKPKSFQA